jgi:hypothetical protein
LLRSDIANQETVGINRKTTCENKNRYGVKWERRYTNLSYHWNTSALNALPRLRITCKGISDGFNAPRTAKCCPALR